MFKVQTRIYFSTPFIISNAYGGLTSKLQATISINNALINGSKTLAKSIKSITLEQRRVYCWTMRPFNKGSHAQRFTHDKQKQPASLPTQNNSGEGLKTHKNKPQVRFARETTTSGCSWSLLQTSLTLQNIGSWKLFLLVLCLQFMYFSSLQHK